MFEGADAAGKGSAIRRVTGALDARQYLLVPIGAPTDEERAHPYLWRFWRHVPRRGGITIFDRSWYGRVLVERIEGFCTVADWPRAYDEINDFEEDLADAGIIVAKFWLQISKAEQLARFKAREQTSFKRFKITQEDWRNRKKWADYERAVADMVDRTQHRDRARGRWSRPRTSATPADQGPAHDGRRASAPRSSAETTSGAPSRSCTLAAVTVTASSSPSVSTTRCRLRPLTFLPAS